MINLLPTAYRRELTKAYWLRLGIVGLYLASGALVAGALLLVPSFFSVYMQERYLKQERAVQEERAKGNVSVLQDTLRQSSQRVAIVKAKYAETSLTEVLSSIIEKKPAGITLSSLQFDGTKESREIVIEGESVTRDTLVLFDKALKEDTRIASVTLPISNLASSADISFRITITLAPTPAS